MNIDSIQNGIVLDHITAGKAMLVYKYLHLDRLDILGYIDPDISVSIIKDGVTVEKKKVGLPDRIVNVVKCKNPRCITTTEQGIQQIFKLTDPKKRIYRCVYCEAENQGEEL